jgi:hypothetical protein
VRLRSDADRSPSALVTLLALISPPIFRQPYGVPSSRTSSKPPFTREGKSVGSARAAKAGVGAGGDGVGEGFCDDVGSCAGAGVGVDVGMDVGVEMGIVVGLGVGGGGAPWNEKSSRYTWNGPEG